MGVLAIFEAVFFLALMEKKKTDAWELGGAGGVGVNRVRGENNGS